MMNEGNFNNSIVYLFFLINFLKLSGIDIASKFEHEEANREKYYETFRPQAGLNNHKEKYRVELKNILEKGAENINNYELSEDSCKDILNFLDLYLHKSFETKNIFKSKYIFKKINETI